jgi:hypothetical protein
MNARTEQDRSNGKIEFISFHKPAVQPGDYSIQAVQHLSITTPEQVEKRYAGKLQKFRVKPSLGRLNPDQIKAVYPPEGSLGDHSLTLPHVVLSPSTLPWESSGTNPSNTDVPWLALISFTDEEIKQVSASTKSADSPVAIITLPAELLSAVMPQQQDIRWLAHVRQAVDDSGKLQGDEVAVIMGHRLPVGGGNIAHLVAIDGKFDADSFPPASGTVELVTLKSWRFNSIDPKHGFVQQLIHLDQGVFKQPGSGHPLADSYLQKGTALLPHHMREGNKSASWYRGPLIPGFHAPRDEVAFPVESANELVRFNESIGMFDVSYAVAWELGRMLMLNHKGAALDLYRWKQANAQKIKVAERQIDHLPFGGAAGDLNLPSSVVDWFDRTALLQNIPFHNLVPDEKLLPTDSIRFFNIDWRWVECLLDGAFSIGRVTAVDYQQDQDLHAQHFAHPHRRMTGFLLRSAVVADYPDLKIDVYDSDLAQGTSTTRLLVTIPPNQVEAWENTLSNAVTGTETSLFQLQTLFSEHGLVFSATPTVDHLALFITDNDIPLIELTKANSESNKIDLRKRVTPTEHNYLGQIDSSFDNLLTNSGEFHSHLNEMGADLPPTAEVTTSRWFVTDGRQGNYLVERHGSELLVFRDHKLPALRIERLSKNTLLVIVEGQMAAVDFHLKPEALHHGVHSNETGGLFKLLKDDAGEEQNDRQITVTLTDADWRTIDVSALAGNLAKSNEPSEFALQMVEGIPKVRFSILD